MFSEDMNTSPINPIAPVVLALAIAVFGTELVLQAGENGWIGGPEAIGWRVELINRFAFYDPIFEHMRQNREYSGENLLRQLAYPVVHASFHHAFLAAVMMLALGKKVAEEFSGKAVAIIVPVSLLAGSLAYGLLDNSKVPLIGSFPAVWGLLGAYTWILWLQLDGKGRARWTAFKLVGFLTAMQLFWYFAFGGQKDWIAYVAGFLAGFSLSFVLSPDGGPRLRRWLAAVRG